MSRYRAGDVSPQLIRAERLRLEAAITDGSAHLHLIRRSDRTWPKMMWKLVVHHSILCETDRCILLDHLPNSEDE